MTLKNSKIEIITDSATTPVTLAEVKQWLRVDHTSDDDKITQLIQSAINQIEAYTGTAIITKTFRYTTSCSHFDSYGKEFVYLPHEPLEISHVKIYDTSDNSNTLTTSSNYSKKVLLGAHEITARNDQAYEVQYTSGIAATAEATPSDIKICIKELVSMLYDGMCDGSTNSPTANNSVLSIVNPYIDMDNIGIA